MSQRQKETAEYMLEKEKEIKRRNQELTTRKAQVLEEKRKEMIKLERRTDLVNILFFFRSVNNSPLS
jgi:hypothetical protein